MKMLLNVVLPTEKFNESVRDGTVGQKLSRILDEQKPEAAYFTGQEGGRSVILIVDVAEPSMVPTLAEPWFLLFEAEVDFRIVMSPADLAKAHLDEIGKKWA
jgi:hypothetical protein